jgi:hypothetical protein
MALPLIRWVTKAVFDELVSDLRLRDEPIDPTSDIPFQRLIIPVYQVNAAVAAASATQHGATADLDLSVASGTYVVGHTVPAGKRWKILIAAKENSTSNTYIEVYDVSEGVRVNIYGTADTALNSIKPDIYLEAGDSIGMWANQNGADTAIELAIWYQEEAAAE